MSSPPSSPPRARPRVGPSADRAPAPGVTDFDRSPSDALAARAADDVLLVTDDEWLTAEICRRRVATLASALADLGVGAGDRIATLQALSVDAVLLWWALDRLGAVYVPLNPVWTPRLIRRVVHDREPAMLLIDAALRSIAERGAGDVPVDEAPRVATASPAARTEPATATRDPLADCAIVHNSGLPGIHHGMRVNARMLTVMGSAMAAAHPGDRVLVAGATCFMGTLASIHGAIANGGSVALLANLTPETFWPAMRRAGVTFAALLNPTLADLMARPESPSEDRNHPLRLITASSAQAELNDAGARRFGLHWMTGLAKTEVCGAVSTGLDPRPTDGVGRVRPPFTGRIVGIEDGQPVPTGTPGELVLRCDVAGGLPPGYADDPAASADLWRGGWMHTGWHLSQDAEGSLHPEGDLSVHPIVVKRAGYLFAADLEAEITAVGTGVTGARVATRPGADALADPTVIAWVTGELDPDGLRTSLRAGLPAHLVPDLVVPVRELPAQPEPARVPAEAWMF
jgi:crotonobetaine/carnitine-CoA ligase